MKLILASKSPRRKELLKKIGVDFEISAPKNAEIFVKGMPIDDAIKLIALKKAQEIYEKGGGGAVLSADSVVVFGGEVIGKPESPADAVNILKKLSGKEHLVKTAIAFIGDGFFYNECITSKVVFNELSDEFIKAYVESGSPLDKAGAYGIQDKGIVKEYYGSYDNIVGLPTERVDEILIKEGFKGREKNV